MADDLSLLRRRDRSAIEQLYDRHAGRLFAVALRTAGDRDAAAAALEEAFAVVAAGEPYDGTAGSPAAWLVRLTRDRAVSRQARMPVSPVLEKGEADPRQLVEEAFFGGRSVAELAASHGLTEEAVRSMLRDGMAALRRQFAART